MRLQIQKGLPVRVIAYALAEFVDVSMIYVCILLMSMFVLKV